MAADATNDDDGTASNTNPATDPGGAHLSGAPQPDPAQPEEDNRDVDVAIGPPILKEIRDALQLADYIVKHGTTRDNVHLPATVLRTIKFTAGAVGLFENSRSAPDTEPAVATSGSAAATIKASDWTRFELAYYDLAKFASPVTVDTLSDTRATGKRGEVSPAQAFTRWLWFITTIFIILVVLGGIISTGADTAGKGTWRDIARFSNNYVPILVPWMYGALGACAYLLRSAHDLIAKRCFDRRRQPEYFNRILLGAVSGGSIVLLVSPSGDDDTLKISAAALGFIAGYSNDLLFKAVERVTEALLPKVGLETMQKERLAPKPIEVQAGELTLKDLMERMDKATEPEEKALYLSLITKLRDRL